MLEEFARLAQYEIDHLHGRLYTDDARADCGYDAIAAVSKIIKAEKTSWLHRDSE